jgi:hypothetical protein
MRVLRARRLGAAVCCGDINGCTLHTAQREQNAVITAGSPVHFLMLVEDRFQWNSTATSPHVFMA